ncbi:hypothetical protein [uncultured Parasphingopyxis sp.]|uniref:hypothetical protein n=1 Tax=uncultured Parasphingopyxis sp. TaxID=1547918 RepID=UPI002633B422|nr:hypothetical protein [uncultured Parasphingopyxis sp.]
MKTLTKTFLGATAAVALTGVTATSAQAQYRQDNGIDAGDVLTGVAILGGVAAIIAAASDDDDRYDDRHDRRYGDRYDRRNGYAYGRMNPRQAVQQCVAAARQEGLRYGRDARVTQVTDVDRNRNGYEVEGRIVVDESRYGRNGHNRWNRNARYDRDWDRGRFDCDIRHGRVTNVRIRGI